MTASSHLMQAYNRLPVSFERGEGCWLYDRYGKPYFDALCGISVTNLGHSHSAVSQSISKQAATLMHTSNLFQIDAQEQLASLLCHIAGMDRVFFSNSGAEANEAAIKLARLHAHNNGNHNPLIITFNGSFHGRTLGTLAATPNDAIKQGFGPILPGFIHLPFNDIDAVEQCFAANDNIAAVLIEPVQGEGGVHIAEPAFLKRLQQLCHQADALFMLDEIQSGNGRCGSYFACQRLDNTEYALQPDVITTAKALGNGMPIGACLAQGAAADVIAPGKHGSTFGGNPLACTVAKVVVKTIIDQQLPQRALVLGDRMHNAFSDKLSGTASVKAIRHYGLMLGIELDRPCTELMSEALNNNIIINVTAGNVVRLLPPLIMSNEECDHVVDKVATMIHQFLQA